MGPRPLDRFAYTRTEAAKSLGMGLTTFETYVQPDLAVVRVGRKVLIPAAELGRWVTDHSERVLGTTNRKAK